MKKKMLLILFALIGIPLALNASERTITLVHTNDMHSHLLGFYPNIDYTPQAGDDKTRGGWARIKTVIKKNKGRARQPGPGR